MPEIPDNLWRLRNDLLQPCPACADARQALDQLRHRMAVMNGWRDKTPRLAATWVADGQATTVVGCTVDLRCPVCDNRGHVLRDGTADLLDAIRPLLHDALTARRADYPEAE